MDAGAPGEGAGEGARSRGRSEAAPARPGLRCQLLRGTQRAHEGPVCDRAVSCCLRLAFGHGSQCVLCMGVSALPDLSGRATSWLEPTVRGWFSANGVIPALALGQDSLPRAHGKPRALGERSTVKGHRPGPYPQALLAWIYDLVGAGWFQNVLSASVHLAFPPVWVGRVTLPLHRSLARWKWHFMFFYVKLEFLEGSAAYGSVFTRFWWGDRGTFLF